MFGDVKVVRGDLGFLLGNMSDAQEDIVSLSNALTMAQTSIDTLQKDIMAAQGSISSLETEIGTCKGSVETLGGDVTSLTTSVMTAQADIDNLETAVGELPNGFESFGGAVAMLKKVLACNAERKLYDQTADECIAAEEPLKPKTCETIRIQAGTRPPSSGWYTIYPEGETSPAKTYCDFSAKPAWTLVRSFSLANLDQFRGVSFRQQTQATDGDENQFAMSLAQNLALQGTHWRATCNMQTTMTRDYVLTPYTSLNPLTFDARGQCSVAEAADIRGHSCESCAVPWWQENSVCELTGSLSYTHQINR